jgi:hypothetical protein
MKTKGEEETSRYKKGDFVEAKERETLLCIAKNRRKKHIHAMQGKREKGFKSGKFKITPKR